MRKRWAATELYKSGKYPQEWQDHFLRWVCRKYPCREDRTMAVMYQAGREWVKEFVEMDLLTTELMLKPSCDL